jgi:Cu-Zn family superoxide dismutase
MKSSAPVLIAAILLAACGGSDKQEAVEPTPPVAEPVAEPEPTAVEPTEPAPPAPAEPAPPPEPQVYKARADIKPFKGKKISGTVTFEQTGDQTVIRAQFAGLKRGMHGFHLHEVGDCSGPKAPGEHFNPGGHPHAMPDAEARHAGDFGNVEAAKDGTATAELTVKDLTVAEGANSVVGRAVVVHDKKDDGTTQPSGKSGNPVACGVVVMATDEAPVTDERESYDQGGDEKESSGE